MKRKEEATAKLKQMLLLMVFRCSWVTLWDITCHTSCPYRTLSLLSKRGGQQICSSIHFFSLVPCTFIIKITYLSLNMMDLCAYFLTTFLDTVANHGIMGHPIYGFIMRMISCHALLPQLQPAWNRGILSTWFV